MWWHSNLWVWRMILHSDIIAQYYFEILSSQMMQHVKNVCFVLWNFFTIVFYFVVTRLWPVFFQYFIWQKSNPVNHVRIFTPCVHLPTCYTLVAVVGIIPGTIHRGQILVTFCPGVWGRASQDHGPPSLLPTMAVTEWRQLGSDSGRFELKHLRHFIPDKGLRYEALDSWQIIQQHVLLQTYI
jgi:hypothetical protein